MKYKYRCGRRVCRRVHTLTKAPEEYRITKKCSCGGTLHDYSMDRKRNKARTCNCHELSHPHKKGSSIWCRHHPTGPTEDDFRSRYA